MGISSDVTLNTKRKVKVFGKEVTLERTGVNRDIMQGDTIIAMNVNREYASLFVHYYNTSNRMKEEQEKMDELNTLGGDMMEAWESTPLDKWDHDIHTLQATLSQMKKDRPTLKEHIKTLETMVMDLDGAASFEDCEKRDLINFGEDGSA